jgi:adenosine deaminase
MRSPDDVRRVVTEIVEDAASCGAVWVEPLMWPGFLGGRLGTDAEVLEIVLEAGRQAAQREGIGFGLMVAANRNLPPDDALHLARVAAGFSTRGVVSFGLDNDEAAFAPEPFAPAFAVAKDAGLLSAPHAGELAGAPSVRAALDALSADRIGHGVRAVEDPRLVDRLAEAEVCLDVCPTSNVALSVVETLADHPLPVLLDAGVCCSVNADDPLLFGVDLLDEYERCRTTMGLGDARLADVARSSVTASGMPADLRRSAVGRIDDWLAADDGR